MPSQLGANHRGITVIYLPRKDVNARQAREESYRSRMTLDRDSYFSACLHEMYEEFNIEIIESKTYRSSVVRTQSIYTYQSLKNIKLFIKVIP